MSYFLILFAMLLLLDARRLRARFRSIPVLSPGDLPVDSEVDCEHVFLTSGKVEVDKGTASAASLWATRHHLELLDLVPANASAIELLRMFQKLEPGKYTKNRIALGFTSGYALMAARGLLGKAGMIDAESRRDASLFASARQLKRFAIDRVGIVIAPQLRAPNSGNGIDDYRTFEDATGSAGFLSVVFQTWLLLILMVGVFVSPLAGVAALCAYHLQPVLIFSGLAIRPRDLLTVSLLRSVLEAWQCLKLLSGFIKDTGLPGEQAETLRQDYETRMASGLNSFFEPPREDCPFCGSGNIRPRLRTTDMFQDKPGNFELDFCVECGHVFQNPRLSISGLNFYYADFYDGLGAATLERLFQADPEAYAHRTQCVARLGTPARWLDVGAAHGHFCCYAKGVLPETQFDGLDMSVAIHEAVQATWVDQGYQGLFPEVAPSLVNTYDVVSIFHCLEHVLKPEEEIKAAHTVLAHGGLLLIEVPNPEAAYGKLFGRFWQPWFQPQHIHMLPHRNLCRLLRRHGFEPILVEGTHTQKQLDPIMAVMTFFNWLAPKPGRPWRPRGNFFSHLTRIVWILGVPLLVIAFVFSALMGPIFRKYKLASAYRVLARKTAIATSGLTEKNAPELALT